MKDLPLWTFKKIETNGTLSVEKPREHVILFVLKGKVEAASSNEAPIDVEQNEMLILPSITNTSIANLHSSESQILLCRFSLSSLFSDRKIVDEITLNDINDDPINKKLHFSKTISTFILLLYRYHEDKIETDYLMELKRRELSLLLFKTYSKQQLAHFFNAFLSKDVSFKQVVVENCQKVKNVQELAVMTNNSVSGFIKRFKRTFNESPYRWMQQQRAANILRDIKNGEKSLQELAVDYKFSSYQHFASFCKRHFKMPPTAINANIML